MTKFWTVSDIHTDFDNNEWMPPEPPEGTEALVCAGDLCTPLTSSLEWLHERFPGFPVLYTPGNHDFYWWNDQPKTTFQDQILRGRELAARYGIHLLMDDAVTFGDTRVLGATLWTDFMTRPGFVSFDDAVRAATRDMNDYRRIRVEPGTRKHRLRVRDTIDMHKTSRKWLASELKKPREGPLMVMTHHAPSPRSLGKRADLDWCYASDLEDLMHGPSAPDAWMHGHVHRNLDYTVGDTRVFANPRGYVHRGVRENPDFDPVMATEVVRRPDPAPSP